MLRGVHEVRLSACAALCDTLCAGNQDLRLTMPQYDADDCMCCRRIGVSQLGNEEGGKHAFAMHLLRRVPVSAEQESACCWLLCSCLISPPHQDSESWRSSTTVALAAGSSASRALRNQFAGSLAFAMHYDLDAMSTTRTPTTEFNCTTRIPSCTGGLRWLSAPHSCCRAFRPTAAMRQPRRVALVAPRVLLGATRGSVALPREGSIS